MNQVVTGSRKFVSKITRADMGLALPRLDMDQQVGLEGQALENARRDVREKSAEFAHCYDLGGVIRKTKAVKGKGDQDGVQFMGEFKAVLAVPGRAGEQYISGKAHVPKMFEEILYAQVVQAQQADPEASVAFLIRVGIKPPKPGKPSAVGYEWTVEPLVETERPLDPVEALFNQAAARALPPPSAPAPAPETSQSEEAPRKHAAGGRK